MFRRLIDPLMLRVLTDEVGKVANEAKRNAGWSKKIPSAISIIPATTNGEGRYEASIQVDLEVAPEARAFEFGSGLRAEFGNQTTYPIRAKNAPMLSFLWKYPSPLGLKNLPYDEQVFFRMVNHPGVAAKPYLRPAIETHKPSMIAKIANVFSKGLLDSIVITWKEK